MKSMSPLHVWLIQSLVFFSSVSRAAAVSAGASSSTLLRSSLVQDPLPAVPQSAWTPQTPLAAQPLPVQSVSTPAENPDEVKWHLKIGKKPLPPVEPTVGPRLYATPEPTAPPVKYAPVTPPPQAAVTESPYWRPWETRWDPKPINMSSSDYVEKPENRRGYFAFAREHPRHALAPNSIDRDAESTVILVFAFCILGTVLLGVLGIEQAQNQKLEALVLLTALPWILLELWVLRVFATFVASPTRISVATGSHWQCDGLVWYLFFAPLLAALTCVVQVIWVFQANLRDSLAPAAMGRMMNGSRYQQSSHQPSALVVALGRVFLLPAVRYGILAGQSILIIFGIVLVFFTGHNRDFCEPEVWWTSALMVTATTIAVIVALGAVFFCVCLSRFMRLKFVQDFMRSFHDSSVDDEFLAQQKRLSEDDWAKQPSFATGTPSYMSSGSANMQSAAWPAPFTPSATSRSSNFEWLSVGSPAAPVQLGAASPSFSGNPPPQSFPPSPQERRRSGSPNNRGRSSSQLSGPITGQTAPTFGGGVA